MPSPHEIVAAIASNMQAQLNEGAPDNARKIAVRAHDGRFLFDGKTGKPVTDFPDPCILVYCAKWNGTDAFIPAHADGLFVATILARTKQVAAGKDSSADVAMDLAAALTSLLERDEPQLWPYGESKLGAVKRPYSVVAANECTNELTSKGLSAWTVAWRQEFEVSTADEQVHTLLKRIHFTLAMGPGDDIDEQLADDTADIEIMAGEPLPAPPEPDPEP